MLGPIRRAKYPTVTEAEEAVSLPLQVLVLGIFDAVLLHFVTPGRANYAISKISFSHTYLKKHKHTQ